MGNIPIETEDEVALLVAQSMAVDLAEEMPEDVDGLVDVDINEYIPIPWRSKMSLEKWAAKGKSYSDRPNSGGPSSPINPSIAKFTRS